MKNITIITIANNKDVYDSFVDNLLKQKDINLQLLTVNNYNNIFNSAVEAYNSILKQAKYSPIIFCHPDIRFLDNNALQNIVEQVNQLSDYGVVGVAGADFKQNLFFNPIVLTTIVHGKNKDRFGVTVNKPTCVQTVDECLFIVDKDYFDSNNFNEIIGAEHLETKWHLYSVNLCLTMIKNNKKNYVIPSKVWHLSNGNHNLFDYMKLLELLIKEYRNSFSTIYTTIKVWNTKGIISYLFRKYYYAKQIIKYYFSHYLRKCG